MNTPEIVELNGVKIAYHDIGEGRPVLLIHGFGSNGRINWFNTNWVKTLNDAGYRCIVVDNRGHGESQKFYSPDDYGPDIFAADAVALLDHLKLDKVDVVGYSMGARITAWISAHWPERVNRAVFGGMGARMIRPRGKNETIAHALETDDPSSITDEDGVMFRKFAEHTGSDLKSLAACIRPSRKNITEDIVKMISAPVLIAVGDIDDVGGSASELAEIMQNATAYDMPGLDHMKSTGAKEFKQKTLEFLTQ